MRRFVGFLSPTVLALTVFLVGVGPCAEAQDVTTDVVELASGDLARGELKALDRAELTFKTNDMGTVRIAWSKVVRVSADREFEVVTVSGARVRGTLASPAQGVLQVDGPGGAQTLNLVEVISISAIDGGWLGNIDGSLDVGFSYTRGSGIAQTSGNFAMTGRRPSFETSIDFNTISTQAPDTPESSRSSLRYTYLRYVGQRWLIAGLADALRNTDQGIDFRGSAGGGVGYRLVTSQRQSLVVVGSAMADHEVPVSAEATSNAFAVAGASYALFLRAYPKTTLDIDPEVRFGLTEGGRFLFNLNTSARQELWRDFYVALTLYDSYDNRPPGEGAIKNDVGVTLSIGWSF